MGNKFRVSLKAPVQTADNPLSIVPLGVDIVPYGEVGTTGKHVANNGFLKGGLTNSYLSKTALAASSKNFVDANGGVISLTTNSAGYWDVKVGGRIAGGISQYGVLARTVIEPASDVFLTADDTYVTVEYVVLSSSAVDITITEYDFSNVQQNTRTISFTGTSIALSPSFTTVRYLDMHYADPQMFVMNGHLLDETYPSTYYIAAPTLINFCWRDEVGNGFFLSANGATSQGYHGDSAWTTFSAVGAVTWSFAAEVNGHSVVICTTDIPQVVSTHAQCTGYIGYDSAGTYHDFTWESTTAVVTSTVRPYAGYGYGECLGIGTPDNFWLSTPCVTSFTAPYTEVPVGTATSSPDPVGYFGALTNTYIESVARPFSFRYLMTGGVPGGISVADSTPLSGYSAGPRNMGVLISGVGEIDPLFSPHVQNGDTILWRYDGRYYIVKIGDTSASAAPWYIQKISDTCYKTNTISANNIIDIKRNALYMGSIDFNGRLWPYGGVSFIATAAAMIFDRYCSSIDPGEKTGAYSFTSAVSSDIPPFNQNTSDLQSVIVYSAGAFDSVIGIGTDVWANDPNFTQLQYAPSTFLPVPLGVTYGDRYVYDGTKILLLDWFYVDLNGNQHESDLYVIGNQVTNFTNAFQLYGNIYVFDGAIIWLAQIINNQYATRTQTAVATGLSFLAESPDAVFFLSTFDNTVWVFNGSQTLSKVSDFNQIDPILAGAFNVKENTLVLLTATRIVFVRDGGLISVQTRDSSQAAMAIYSTNVGIIFANNSYSFQYTFNNAGVVVPLTWQSAYYGQTGMQKHQLSKIWMILYDSSKAQKTITISVYTYNETGAQTQSKQLVISPNKWDSNGIARVRIQPQNQKALGTSVGLSTSDKITILDVFYDWSDDAPAVIDPDLSV